MAEEENPCKKGLTPECFKKYPKYAKKVFAYKLMQAVIGSPLSSDLLKMLWRHLVQIPISWMEWADFIIPDDIPLEEIISEDWDTDDPLPDELTINLNEIIPDDWEEGDELPDGVTIEPGTEIPDDWKVGDEIPDGITIDTSKLFADDWTTGDPLPEGIVINIDVVLPEVWTIGEDLPFGITVNPDFRIDVDMLETLGIYIEEGKTYEGLFGTGWDPTTELPDGSSWKPYKTDEVIIESAVPPLYLPVFEPGPVHRPSDGAVATAGPWLDEPFNDFSTNAWTASARRGGFISISGGKLHVGSTEERGRGRIMRTDTRSVPHNIEIEIKAKMVSGDGEFIMEMYNSIYECPITWEFPDTIFVLIPGSFQRTVIGNYMGADITWLVVMSGSNQTIYKNGVKVMGPLSMRSGSTNDGFMYVGAEHVSDVLVDSLIMTEI